MSDFADIAFAVFALQQPVTLAEIAELTPERRLLMAGAKTPEWFAAAASSASSLPDIAPELRERSGDVAGAEGDGIDLVWLYAPELRELEEKVELAVVIHSAADPVPLGQPAPSVHIGLLRELSDFDS